MPLHSHSSVPTSSPNESNMPGTTNPAGESAESAWLVCNYCSKAFDQYYLLVWHKLESHPLQYAEERSTQNYERMDQNVVQHYSSFTDGVRPVTMEQQQMTEFSGGNQNNCHRPSASLSSPLPTTELVTGYVDERARTSRPCTVPGSFFAEEPSSFHSATWKEADDTLRPIRIQPTRILQNEPRVTLHYQPTNWYLQQGNIQVEQTQSRQFMINTEKYRDSSASVGDLFNFSTNHDVEGVANEYENRNMVGQEDFQSFLQVQSGPSLKTYDCSICEGTFSNPEALRIHYTTHMEEGPNKCHHCGFGFKTSLSRLKHLYLGKCAGYSAWKLRNKMPRSMMGRGRCDGLQQRRLLPKPEWLNREADATNLQQRESTEENRHVPNAIDVKKKAKLAGKSYIQCAYCLKRLSSEHLFQIHLTLHSGDKPYSCNVCHAKFANVQGLATHSKSQRCGLQKARIEKRSLKDKHDLTSRRRSRGECQQNIASDNTITFYLADGSSDPQGIVDVSQLSSSEPSQSPHGSQGSITCPYCNKQFRSGYFLRAHLRNHTGNLPYSCTQCGEKFVSSQSLSNHRRSHFKDGAYKCLQCGKRFTSERKHKYHVLRECAVQNAVQICLEKNIFVSEQFPVINVDVAEQSAAAIQTQDIVVSEVLDIEGNLAPLQKTGPAPWIIVDRLRQIETRPISLFEAERMASALPTELLNSLARTLQKVKRVVSEVDVINLTEETDNESDEEAFQIRIDHCYSVQERKGRKLWEKALQGVKAIINQFPSHQRSKCRAFFADDIFTTHRYSAINVANKHQIGIGNTHAEVVRETPHSDDHVESSSSSQQGNKLQADGLYGWSAIKRTPLLSSITQRRWSNPRTIPNRGLGRFKCPLCETRFRQTRTVRSHLITYHRVSTANQRALGFGNSANFMSSNMTWLTVLAENLNECIGKLVKTAEDHRSIRARFRQVGRSNSFEMDI